MSRFILQQSSDKGYWVCTDTLNKVVCKFKEHEFNDTQEFTTLEDFNFENYMKLAAIGREIGDWLKEHYYEKVF